MLTKEQIEKIKKRLSGCSFGVDLKIVGDDRTISIRKEFKSDEKLIYAVYFDGKIKGKWNEKTEPLVPKLWCKKSIAIWKPKQIKEIENDYKRIYRGSGRLVWKKKMLESFPELYDKKTYYSPYFTSLRTLIATLRRVEWLELAEK